MKKYLLHIALIACNVCAAQQSTEPCPASGKSDNAIERHDNYLKNRDITQGVADATITLDTLLKGMPDDSALYSPDKFVTITGWVVEAEDIGPESCNCFSTDSTQSTIRIYLAASLNSWKDSIMVVELTPKFIAKYHVNADMLFEEKIQVSGYLMFNHEARKFSLNSSKRSHITDRKTAWEIAPVTQLLVVGKAYKGVEIKMAEQ